MRKTLLILSSAMFLALGVSASAPMMMEMGVAEMVEPDRAITLVVEGSLTGIKSRIDRHQTGMFVVARPKIVCRYAIHLRESERGEAEEGYDQ